jgi:hypothetical protein
MKKIFFFFLFSISLKNISAQAIAKAASDPFEQFKMLAEISESSGLHSGELDSAGCVEMLRIAEELNNDSMLAISYNLIGEYVSRIRGDNANGLEYFFKAIPLAEKVNDKRRISSIYFDISVIFLTLENYGEALKYNRLGGANLPDKSHPLYNFMLAQYLRGMASYFVNTKQADSALAYTQPLTTISRKLNSPLFKLSSFYLSGAAYDLEGDDEMAETYFKKANAILDSVNSPASILKFSMSYIPFLFKAAKLADAKMQAKHLLNIGDKLGNNDIKLAGAGFMRQVYDSLHRADSAYYFARIQIALGDSVFSQDNEDRIQTLAFNEKLRIMDEETKVAAAEEQREQNIQYALIALGIVLFIIVFLLLSRSIITNTKVIEFFGVMALLIVFEFLNLFLHPFLEKITNHSTLLMLLALVVIAAILVPLHHKAEHWTTKKLIEKNKQIRLAAAKKTIEKLEKES